MDSITTDQLKNVLEDNLHPHLLIDVRSKEEFEAGHIPGAHNIPLGELNAEDPRLQGGSTVYVNCLGGVTSAQACQILGSEGIPAVNVTGGFRDWQSKGYTINAVS